MTDEQAMWRVQAQDDPEAFTHLVQRWRDAIHRLCVRMTGDEHRAEDLAQEAFTRLYSRRKEWQPAAKISTWLWRVAVNLCHDELRRRGRRGETSLERVEEEAELPAHLAVVEGTPHESLAEADRAGIVRQALMRLPETHRPVVILKHYEGLKFREIAEVLGIPEGTAKSRMFEALGMLNRRLAPKFKDEYAGAQDALANPRSRRMRL
jgi:RNA polymerase sigma-70 factor, ECF subfamily